MYPNWNKTPRPELSKTWEIYKSQTDFQIIELKVYQKMMEGQFSEREKEKQNGWDPLFEHFFRTTFLAQIYTVLEYNIRFVCMLTEKHNYQTFSINDLKGNSDLQRGKEYLEKTIGINIAQLQEWNTIKDCQRIRNCVVHDYCFYDKGDAVDTFISKTPGFGNDTTTKDIKRDVIVKSFRLIDGTLNQRFINSIDGLFNNLYKQIIDFHNSLN